VFAIYWEQVLLLAVGLLLLAAPFVLGTLLRRAEARAFARGELEPTVGEWMLRAFLVVSVLLMIFTPIIAVGLILSGAEFF